MRVLSLNVRGGLDTGRKLAALLLWMQRMGCGVAFLQEVYGSSNPRELLAECPGAAATFGRGLQWLHEPGLSGSQGCLTLVHPSAGLADVRQASLPSEAAGRVLRVDAQLGPMAICLVNVYAPADRAQRRRFFSEVLPPCLPAVGAALVVAGDFNCISDAVADAWTASGPPPAVTPRTVGAQELGNVCATWDLFDVWRDQHPQTTGIDAVTHHSAPHRSGARLDKVLASAAFLALAPAASAEIAAAAGVASDHRPVLAAFRPPAAPLPMGRGLPAFPLLLLNDRAAVAELQEFLALVTAPLLELQDTDALIQGWIAAKASFLSFARGLHARRRKSALAAIHAAEAAAAAALGTLGLAATLPQGAGLPVDEAYTEMRRSADAVPHAWQAKAAGSLQAAELLDHLHGDSATFFFHAQAKAPPAVVPIAALNRPGRGPEEPPGTADLSSMAGVALGAQHAAAFFSSDAPSGLFRERAASSAAQQQLWAALPPPLSGPAALEGEGPSGDGLIAVEELDWALARARRGSAPGSDGLPYEVYRAFQAQLLPVLRKLLNTAFSDLGKDSPLAALLDGVICLILKPGKPPVELDSYRPITLLNADVKLAMLILSARLQRPLEYIIDVTQTAFLLGRDISENIRYAQGLAARLEELGLPAWMLQTDLTKAYDSVQRSWLLGTMRRMGFADTGAVRWAQVLLGGSTSRARVNGFLSEAFPVRSSLAQGSAVSCQEWLIAFEPLLRYLSSLAASGRLPTLQMPISGRQAPVVTAYADDTSNTVLPAGPDPVSALQTAAEFVAAFDVLAEAGGPALSLPKSRLVNLSGPRPLPPAVDPVCSPCAPCGLRLAPLDVPTRLLGAHVAAPAAACTASAFAGMPAKIVAAGSRWEPLRLNALGRAHVAMQCLASKAVFASAFSQPTQGQLQAMQRSVSAFTGTSALPEEEAPFPGKLFPRLAIAALQPSAGGFGAPDLGAAFAAMRSKVVWRALASWTAHPWRELFLHEVARAQPTGSLAPPGASWVVVEPSPDGFAGIASPAFRSAVEAFCNLQIARIVPPERQSFRSIMLETVFGNAASGLLLPDAVTTQAARAWRRLSDVRATFFAPQTPVLADVAIVLDSLPPAWRDAVTCADAPADLWRLVQDPQTTHPVLSGPWPETGRPPPLGFIGLWDLLPTGRLALRLQQLGPGLAAAARPALVTTRPKPRHAYTAEDLAYVSDQRDLPAEQRQVPLDAFLVGFWDELPVDPMVWGLPDGPPLLDLTVGDARRHLQLTEAAGRVDGVRLEKAAYPAIWKRDGDVGPAVSAVFGLSALEARWRDSAAAIAAHAQGAGPSEDRGPPAWLALGQHGSTQQAAAARASRAAQRALAAPPAPPAQLRPGFAAAWRRLSDNTIHRPFRVTAMRILHGCLGVPAFLTHVRREGSPYCSLPCCAGEPRIADLSHVFLNCPAAAPVVAWLFDTWAALTGMALSRTAEVLLADDLSWPGGEGNGAQHRQWTRLRVATLGAMWRARCLAFSGRLATVDLPTAAARMATESVLAAVARDWTRTSQDILQLDAGAFCVDWWRGRPGTLSRSQFSRSWAATSENPVFVQLVDGHLSLRLRVGFPTPLPLPLPAA